MLSLTGDVGQSHCKLQNLPTVNDVPRAMHIEGGGNRVKMVFNFRFSMKWSRDVSIFVHVYINFAYMYKTSRFI
jgi:hypothetical protein